MSSHAADSEGSCIFAEGTLQHTLHRRLLEAPRSKLPHLSNNELAHGAYTQVLQGRNSRILEALAAAAPSAGDTAAACSAALCAETLDAASGLPAVHALLTRARCGTGACSWVLLQGCDAASLQAWAGEVRMWVLQLKNCTSLRWPRTGFSQHS